jgi:opacity protein-like surface antigen
MKRIALIAAVVTLCSSFAFAKGTINFGLQATGANINVSGQLKDIYGFGFGGGGHLDINLPVLFAFRLQGDYVSFSADQTKYRQLLASLVGGTAANDYTIDGGTVTILSANANVKSSFLPLPLISPYFTGGIGLANMSAGDATVKYQGQPLQGGTIPGVKGETNFSANVGAGVDLTLGIEIYLEARYTWIFSSGETSTYIPVSLGITF